MNAPVVLPIDGHALPDTINTRSPAEIFADHCAARAMRVVEGILSLREATDEMQGYAKLSGLIDRIGQDEVQTIMSNAFAMAEAEADEFEREMTVRAANLVRQWEMADPRDAWRHTGEAPPPAAVRNSDISEKRAPIATYRTPQSTIDAFWHVVGLCNPERLTAWLDDHPQDAPFLLKLLEGK
jgi:hypothetical protein